MNSILISLYCLTLAPFLLANVYGKPFKSYNTNVSAYVESDEQMTYCEALNSCARNNGRLVSSYDNLATILLAETATSKTGKSFYIGITVFVNKTDETKRKVSWNVDEEDVAVSFPNTSCAVYTLLTDSKETIQGSDCSDQHYHICEEVINRNQKLFLPPTPNERSQWKHFNNDTICATVHKVYPGRHCAFLCNEQVTCRSFWYNDDGDCHLSSLSNVLPSAGDALKWNYYTTQVGSLIFSFCLQIVLIAVYLHVF